MLRIAPSGVPPPTGPEAPPTGAPPDQMAAASGPAMAPPSMPMKLASKSKFDSEKVSPEIARYLSGEERDSSTCSACHHFLGEGGCEVVAGTIDPDGYCCLFDADGGSDESSDGEPQPTPDGAGEAEAQDNIPNGQA